MSFGNQLIALQLKGSALSPLSIIIDADESDFFAVKLQAGEKAERTAQGIVISNINFYQENTDIVDLKPNRMRMEQGLLLYYGIIELLKEKKVLDLFFYKGKAVCKTTIALYAERIIQAFTENFNHGKYEEAAGEIIRLIGLGKGLTPSGDDFLCGVLAGLTCFSGMPEADGMLYYLRKYIADAVKETNDISGAFLKCAVDGYYSEAIIKLPEQTDEKKIADLFSDIGHSSGADTLCGIYFIVETLKFIMYGKDSD
ncbi:DUF2877 domain-containing protein [Lacrimispora sp. 38-1]|uniref:DUF2877 domain-containing protein n=1 Tax=Lacrimispora sp. 38-1 TaxID=3125778 RepID=UPI003CF19272